MTSPSKEEIIENDNKYAKWYDFLERLPELLGLKGVRKNLCRNASGEVLEVATGTGNYAVAGSSTASFISTRTLAMSRRRS